MAEKEYIEREAVQQMINELANEPQYWHNGETYYAGVSAVDMELCEIPTADVVEIKHGRWQYPSYAPNGGSYVMRECSECKYRPSYSGFEYDPYYEPYTNYCPNCGADMRSATDTNVGSKKEGVDNA